MKLKFLLFAILSLLTLGISGCGSDADGLNGAINVEAEREGAVVTATARYTNPDSGNLIGVPIEFSVQIGSQRFDLGTHYTNNSGSVGVSFTPPAFSGTQTITVIAKTGNLTDFDSISLVGSSITVTPPPALTLTSALPTGSPVTVTIPPVTNFVTVTDPFTNDISGHTITITRSVVSSNPGDTVTPPAPSTTNGSGIAPFPGTTATLIVPAVGATESMTITWTVTDTTTGQTGTGITTVSLSKTP